jgi:heme exporter protein A
MLDVYSLSCRRGGRDIFRGISFALEPGAALLVTGENGSGKSTLLRALAGLLPADGTLTWRGQNAHEDPATYRASLRYVGHMDAVKTELTVVEMLNYWRALQGLPWGGKPGRDAFGIWPLCDKPIRYLSAGQKRRLALSRLMLGTADLWLLDEPATALDREAQGVLLDSVARHRADGGIAVVATHHELNVPKAQRHEMKARR